MVGYYYKAKSVKMNQSKQCSSNGSPCRVLNFDEIIMRSRVRNLEKNTMGIDVCKIVKQMGNFDPKNQAKTITPKKMAS
jgi:hypothetical protein